VRLVLVDGRLVIDRARRLSGRGAYIHPRAACLERAARGGLARSLRHAVRAADLRGVAADLSPKDDNWERSATEDLHVRDEGQDDGKDRKNAPGLDEPNAVESAPRTKAKDDRSEDASV
jgi:predicted RNA-binding protein YlxR (DUF448 family)